MEKWYDNLTVGETLQICQEILKREGNIKRLKREVEKAVEERDAQKADDLTRQFIALIKERISDYERYFNPVKIELVEDSLESYLIYCLNSLHRKLVRRQIDFPLYLKEIDRIQNCIEAFNEAREL